MIGSTNLSGGGGIGSDELTATAAYVMTGTTYVGADTNDEIGTGTMPNLTNNTNITHTSSNVTKLIPGDAAFVSTNSDGTTRAQIRYNSTNGFISQWTLFGIPQDTMANAGGLTAAKLMKNQSAFGIAGTATSDANVSSGYMSSGYTAYVNGSKVTGSLAEKGQQQTCSYAWCGDSYCALCNFPEGIYRKNGASWAPEVRVSMSTLASTMGLTASVIKKGVNILGITGTFEGDV